MLPAMTHTTNVRQVLSEAFEAKRARNARYTLRAFARDVDLSVSQMSRVLKGTAGISTESASQIASRLKWNEKETEHFLNLVNIEFSRSQMGRLSAKQKQMSAQEAFPNGEPSAFNHLQEWYYLPLMCLVDLPDFDENPKWIASRLKIEEAEAESALQTLQEIKLLVQNSAGRLAASGEYFSNSKGLPSRAVRQYHRKMLKKAYESVESQNTHERYLSSVMLAVDENQLEEAKQYLKKVADDFRLKFCNDLTQKNQVYALNLQYFGITNLSEQEELE